MVYFLLDLGICWVVSLYLQLPWQLPGPYTGFCCVTPVTGFKFCNRYN